jgi:hypothetical protein
VTDQLEKHYIDDERAVFANDLKFAAGNKKLTAELAALDADFNKDKPPGHDLKARVESLIKGTTLATPKTFAERRTEIQCAIRDGEEARDYLAEKIRIAKHNAGERLAKANKPQNDAAEKLVAEKFLGFYDAFHASWKMRRALLNDGIGLYGAFNASSGIDDALGIPVDINSRWHDLFSDFVTAGHLSKLPVALRP